MPRSDIATIVEAMSRISTRFRSKKDAATEPPNGPQPQPSQPPTPTAATIEPPPPPTAATITQQAAQAETVKTSRRPSFSLPALKFGKGRDAPTAKVPKTGRGSVGLPAAPKRQRSTGWMIGGAALILISGFAAASMAQTYTETVDVLVASEPIAEGEPLRADQLDVVPIAAGQGQMQAIHPTEIDDLIGRVASGPIGKGSVLHPAQFASVDTEEEMVIVGMALEPDEFPTSGLQYGDLVQVFDVGASFDSESVSVAEEVAIGEIIAARPLTGDKIHFSIRVPESTANIITSRATQNALAIALAEQSGELGRLGATLEPTGDADPLAPGEPLEPGEPIVVGESAAEEDE